MNFFSGRPSGFESHSRYAPGIQQGLNQNILQLLSALGGGGQLSPMGGQNYMQDIMGQARKQFEQQTVPGIAERFTSMGEGAQSSGAFQGALGQAGVDLEKQLAGLGLQNQQFQQQQGSNMLSSLLGLGGMENVYRPREASGFEQLLPGLLSALARGGGAYATGGLSGLGSLFGGGG